MRWIIMALLTMMLSTPVTECETESEYYYHKPPEVSTMFEEMSDRSIHVTDAEYEELALLVMAEAEGEPYEGKRMVAAVVLNRRDSDKFPDTIHGVIHSGNAFTCTFDGRMARVKPNVDCYRAVDEVLSGEWEYVKESGKATYFERTVSHNTWHSTHLTRVCTIGHHTFYR